MAIKRTKNLWDRKRKEQLSIKLASKDSKSFWRAWKQLDKKNYQVHKSNVEGFAKHFMPCFNESNTNTQLKNEFDEMCNTYMNAKWSDNDITEFLYVDLKHCM